VIVHLDYTIDT
jgi:hypothetical protein